MGPGSPPLPAPTGPRLLAGLLALPMGFGLMGGVAVIALVLGEAYRRLGGPVPRGGSRAFRERLLAPGLRPLWRGAFQAEQIAARNRRGLPMRIVGLRTVDASTGGPVTVRSAVIGGLFDQAVTGVVPLLLGPRIQEQENRRAVLEPEMQAIRDAHRRDPIALQKALTEFHAANDFNPTEGCLTQLTAWAALQGLIALGRREGRSLRERITGTVIIVDRLG